MSLATRCPKCNTVFQVSEEQLKRYSGVVRCGVCNNPFNGIDHLIGRLSPTETISYSPSAEKCAVAHAPDEEKHSLPIAQRQSQSNPADSVVNHLSAIISANTDNFSESDPNKAREAAMKAAFEKQIQSIDFNLNLSSLDKEKTVSPEVHSDSKSAIDTEIQPVESKKAHTEPDRIEPFLSQDTVKNNGIPDIVVDQSEKTDKKTASPEELVKILRKKEKRSLFSQFLWGIGTLALLALLGVQGIYRYSEEIIAWWPPAEELVSTTCDLLACPVANPTKKPLLTVEAQAPQRLENAPDQYTQNITITNNSPDAQVWPELVIELTDSENNVLLRRIVQPEEYLPEEAGTAKGLQPLSAICFNMTFEFAHNSAVKSHIFILNNP